MKEVYSISEAAKILGVDSNTLRKWDNDGTFRCDFKTVGGRRRYRKETLLAKINEFKGRNLENKFQD